MNFAQICSSNNLQPTQQKFGRKITLAALFIYFLVSESNNFFFEKQGVLQSVSQRLPSLCDIAAKKQDFRADSRLARGCKWNLKINSLANRPGQK